jgi:RNA polymerase sigma-70 factor (ECF subfamily)
MTKHRPKSSERSPVAHAALHSEAPRTMRSELERHLPSLRARALGLCRNKSLAEDLVQDTLVRALRFEATFEVGSNLRAWVHQILLSVFINHRRRLRRERGVMERLGVEPSSWSKSESIDVMRTLSPPVEAALAALPKKFAEVIHLVDLEERAYRDTAEVVGVPVGTVMSRLFRGRRMLAEALREPVRLSA